MKSEYWWRGKKARVRKKYTLMAWGYMSPKELKIWYKNWTKKYLEYLDRYFDENEKWCILNECPYYDHSGRYGGGCADHLAPKGFKCENPYV